MQTYYQIVFLISFTVCGGILMPVYALTPDFLEPCRQHTNRKMMGLDGETSKGTANLAG